MAIFKQWLEAQNRWSSGLRLRKQREWVLLWLGILAPGIEVIALEISGLLLLELARGAVGRGLAGAEAARARENLGIPGLHRSRDQEHR
jgi:hypothetical protein